MESERFFLGKLVEPFLNAVFPRYCVSCKQEGELLCPSCFTAFDDRVFTVEDNHLTMFAYGNPVIRDLIKAYKYNFDHSAFRILQKLAESELQTVKSFIGEGILVPIPLSSLRLRERGFNQAENIARWLSKSTGAKTQNLLKREERKGHQAEKSVEERETAMKRSPFAIGAGPRPDPETTMVIVDDVWTTGSTMKAAERRLREGGIESITFLTIAKG
jgi:competence protein ComFC